MITVVTPLTLALAKAIGIYMIAAGLSGLIAPLRWREIVDGLRSSAALAYLAAVAAFVIGTAMVITHNVWTDPLGIAVTLIGWAAAIEGVVLIVFPRVLLDMASSLIRPASTRATAIGALILGIVLFALGLFGRAGPVA